MEWYIEPVDWDEHQHRDAMRGKSRRIQPWIKLHTQLMHDERWLKLTSAERGLLVSLWLEYAASGCVPLAYSLCAARVQARCNVRTLTSLNHAGWIRFRAGLEEEKEVEVEKEVEQEKEQELAPDTKRQQRLEKSFAELRARKTQWKGAA